MMPFSAIRIKISVFKILSGSKMPEPKRQELVKAFQALKERGIKVLWKWETEEMEGRPDNILLKKWLPQQDVLGKIKQVLENLVQILAD